MVEEIDKTALGAMERKEEASILADKAVDGIAAMIPSHVSASKDSEDARKSQKLSGHTSVRGS